MKNPDTNDQLPPKEPIRQEGGQEKQKDASSRIGLLRKRFKHMFLTVLFMILLKNFGCAVAPVMQAPGKDLPSAVPQKIAGKEKAEQKTDEKAEKIEILRNKLKKYIRDKLFIARLSELVCLYNEAGNKATASYEDRLEEFAGLYGITKSEAGDLVSGFVQSDELREMTREFEESFKEINVDGLLTSDDIEGMFPPNQPAAEIKKDPSVQNPER